MSMLKENTHLNKAYTMPAVDLGPEDAKLLALGPTEGGFTLPLQSVHSWNPTKAIIALMKATVAPKESQATTKKAAKKDSPQFFRYFLVGVPSCLRLAPGDGSKDEDFEVGGDLKTRAPAVFAWKQALKNFYLLLFKDPQDHSCIEKAVMTFSSFAIVGVSNKTINRSFKVDKTLPLKPSDFMILSSITFTVSVPSNGQVLWLATSSVEAKKHHALILEKQGVEMNKIWRGKGLATLLIVALLKHISYVDSVALQDKTNAFSTGAVGPDLYLQCSTLDMTKGSARDFYLGLGFKPCVHPSIANKTAQMSMHTSEEFQKLDFNCKGRLPEGLHRTARSSLGSWIDVQDCIMELMHLPPGYFQCKNELPADYSPPAPWSIQNSPFLCGPLGMISPTTTSGCAARDSNICHGAMQK